MYFSILITQQERMAPQIKHNSGEIYFKGDFVETVLFADGNFAIMYNGVAMVEKHCGKLPDGVVADDVFRVRMADHISPPGIECGPIAVFVLSTARVLVYEYWTNPKMCHSTETNGFWISTNLKVENIVRFYSNILPINIISEIDEEKSSDTVKVTKNTLRNGMFESYDL
jgi:hypothetical protein